MFSLIKKFFAFSLLFPGLLAGCATESTKNQTQVLFETKQEAKDAAKDFNCIGAHKMGDKWMPCKSHQSHQDNKKNGGNSHHHHNK